MICSSPQQIEHVLRKPSISSDRSSACRCLDDSGVSKCLVGSATSCGTGQMLQLNLQCESGRNGTGKSTHISASSADNTSERMALLLLRLRISAV